MAAVCSEGFPGVRQAGAQPDRGRRGCLASEPRPDGTKVITGAHGVLRIRVGDYRVLYTIDEGELVVLVIAAGHRGQIYDR